MNKQIFKNAATNHIRGTTQTYQMTFTVNGSDQVGPNFDPMIFLKNQQFIKKAEITQIGSDGKVTVIDGKSADFERIMKMVQNPMQADTLDRQVQLNEILQNTGKKTEKKVNTPTPNTASTKKKSVIAKIVENETSKKQQQVKQITLTNDSSGPIVLNLADLQSGTTVVIPRIRNKVIKTDENDQIKIQQIKVQQKKQPQVRKTEPEVKKPQVKKPEFKPPPPPVQKPIRQPKPILQKFTVKPGALPAIKKFEFEVSQEKMLTGTFSQEKTSANGTEPLIKPDDCFGNMGIVSLWYQNCAYTDGRYNNTNYKVEKGVLAGKPAYKVYPPLKKFSQFLASQHAIIFQLAEKSDYKVYSFSENSLAIVEEIPSKRVNTNNYTVCSSVKISKLAIPMIYLAEKANQRISPLTIMKGDVQGATIYKDPKITIQLLKFPLPQQPPTPESFTSGPGQHQNCYNPNRNFYRFPISLQQALVWSNPLTDNIYLTTFKRDTYTYSHTKLESKNGYLFAAAIGDSEFVYYAIAQKGELADKKASLAMYLCKAEVGTGRVVKQERVPTGKEEMNLHEFDTCQLAISGKWIGMVLSRKMTQSNDGLNHQGAIAAVYSTQTLKLVKNHGQTSGHSFANTLTVRSDGFFSGMDLGDNYPRGINCWNFDSTTTTSKTVYSFKTRHGDTPKSPAGVTYPAYPQISSPGKNFYKWSNDNRTYTELAAPGLVEQGDGVVVFFCSENLPNPLDNSKTSDYCNCSRNVGCVKVGRNLAAEGVISDGQVKEGGFFCFNGKWNKLTNKGVKWLTNFSGEQNVSRLKATSIGNNKSFLIFQIWTKTSYLNTQYLIVQADGSTQGPIKFDMKIRLHKSDDIFYDQRSNSVLMYAGEKGKNLNRYEVRLS